MYDGSKEDADGEDEPEEEDVAGCGTKHLVEGAAIEGLELAEGAEVENEVDEHEGPADAGIGIEKEGCEGEDGGKDAKPEVDVLADFLAFFLAFFVAKFLDLCLDDAHDDGALAAQ